MSQNSNKSKKPKKSNKKSSNSNNSSKVPEPPQEIINMFNAKLRKNVPWYAHMGPARNTKSLKNLGLVLKNNSGKEYSSLHNPIELRIQMLEHHAFVKTLDIFKELKKTYQIKIPKDLNDNGLIQFINNAIETYAHPKVKNAILKYMDEIDYNIRELRQLQAQYGGSFNNINKSKKKKNKKKKQSKKLRQIKFYVFI